LRNKRIELGEEEFESLLGNLIPGDFLEKVRRLDQEIS